MSLFGNKGSSNGAIKSLTPPINKNIFWLDVSTTPAVLKYFNVSTEQWEQVGGSGGAVDISIIDGGTWA